MTKQDGSDFSPSRRKLLMMGGAGALALAGLANRAAAGSVQTTPAETEGPYWVDDLLNRSDIRVDPTTKIVQPGLPLYLAVSVSQVANGVVSPLPNAFVDIWHCNALGIYSDESVENTLGEKFLRGYQVTNAHGVVKFTTVYPSWYVSRTIHIHARVRLFPNNDVTQTATYNYTTQFFFDDVISDYVINNVSPYNTRTSRDTKNATDSVFNTVSTTAGDPDGDYLLLRLADDGTHAVGSFNMVLDLSASTSTGGGTPPGGGGTPPGGGPPPGGGGAPPGGGGGAPPGGGRGG